MDKLFANAVKRYREDWEHNPIIALGNFKGFLNTSEVESACTLCTRECPARSDSIVECDFRNDN